MTPQELADPIWRICNLYHIVDKSGELVQFRPNEIQLDFLHHMGYRNLILKARQMGFSTLIQIAILDQCIFLDHIHAGIIAQDEPTAAKIFADKIKVAWDNMPSWVKAIRKTVGNSERELRFDNGSYVRVATSLRSATLQYLHVSEFGKICAKFPIKAKEVMTGSIPAVHDQGFVFIESTAEGRQGKFFELVEEAQERRRQGTKLGPRDFRLHFYAWFDCPDYRQDWPEPISEDDAAYFRSVVDQTGVELSPEQMYWYVATRRQNFAGDQHMMRQEYPSMPDEAFERSTEGTWFVTQMAELRRNKRITSVPWVRGVPVETAWDIGRSDGTAIWCFQRIGLDFRVIDFIEGHGEDYDVYVRKLQQTGYVFGRHWLPHDAEQVRQAKTKTEAKSAKTILEELGLNRIQIVPRVEIKITAINEARRLLPQCWFDELRCAAGIVHLDEYRKKWSSSLGMFIDEPVHDVHSEAADAFMQIACGWTPAQQINRERFREVNSGAINPFASRRNS